MKDYVIALKKIRESLTDDDINLLVFFRHHQVHIQVDSIRYSGTMSADGKFQVKMPKYKDAEKVAREYLFKHCRTQQQVANDIAIRLCGPLQELLAEADKVATTT